ncbi:hypothetical protein B0H19DRAFT_140138 [Mycena capillaripes]|nr:hypothetical protein B0H19DRAFT_140138 [Mycena capillaripes]
MEWSTFHGIKGQLLQLRHNLDLYASKTTGSSMPDLRHTWLFIRAKHSLLRMDPIVSIYPESGSDEIAQLRHHIDALLPFPSLILSRYFASSAGLPSLPYRWNETWSMISADLDSSVFPQEFESCLDHLVNVAMATLNIAKVGTIISALLSLWQPTDDTTPIPSAMIDFFNQWDQGLALGNVLRAGGKIEAYLWAHFPPTLLNSCSGWNAELKPNVLTALWRLAALPGRPNVAPAAYLISLHCTQKALAETLNRFPNKHLSQITTSIVLLLKSRIASAQFVSDNGTIGDGLACFKDSIFPMESAIMIPDQVLSANAEERISAAYWLALYECMACRKDEAQIVSLAEFLEQCNSDELPYEAVETVKNIAMEPNKGSVHPKHQIRLANSVQANFVAHGVTGILNAVINCRCWNLYAEEPNGRLGVAQFDSRWPWLDNPAAHRKIRETFAAYAEKFSVSTDLPDILTRLQNILQGLGSWHPEAEATAGCTVFNPM